jgi:glycosyltransferase involved in cell wall biosynthesis
MKVLHVIPSVSLLHGGPSVAVRRMAEVLASLGASVDVATTTADGRGELPVALDEPVCQNGVRYFYFPRQRPKSWTFSWPLTRWLARHVGGYDVLHVHGLFSYPTLPACWAARSRRVPYVLRPLGALDPWGLRQGRWKKALYLRLFERRNLVRSAAVQAVSERERRAIQHLGLPVTIVTVPLGVDPPAGVASRSERMGRPASADGIVTVLFLSRLHAKKGIELLLDAVELLPDEPAVRLVIAGDGEPGYVRNLHERVAEGKATGRVTFTGFAIGYEKRHLFDQADLFVLPSYDENFGLAVAEALSVGLPVVVSEHVALADHVWKAGAGLVVPCDARELAQGIATLVKDPDLRHRMGQAGRRLVSSEFSWPEIGRRLIDLYTEILRSSTCSDGSMGSIRRAKRARAER